jgi:hypothetical protein
LAVFVLSSHYAITWKWMRNPCLNIAFTKVLWSKCFFSLLTTCRFWIRLFMKYP